MWGWASRYYEKFFLMMALPDLLGLLGIVIKLVSLLSRLRVGVRLLCSQVGAFFRSRAYMGTVVFVVFLCYNPLCTAIMSMLNCERRTIGGTYFLAEDLSVECSGTQYALGVAVAVFGACVYAVGIPAGLWMILRQNVHLLGDPEFCSKVRRDNRRAICRASCRVGFILTLGASIYSRMMATMWTVATTHGSLYVCAAAAVHAV